ncbi:hypothetical protein QTQ03_00245 [Micromonospora sp. WMMA1363]|uniref:hypothetical protein n=1 Tax=Micromonospora sp. WMMA1363 TaxID=3053985 RepID=UPI00259CD039|nr:hypothetical protein [Micromonospora sp. WMMA1363]MDM4718097.1 hypothetical protein [Micromonospora sp. WMMA1363]
MSQPPVNPYSPQPGDGSQPGGYPAPQPGSHPAAAQPGAYGQQPGAGFPPAAPAEPGPPFGVVPPAPKRRSAGKILLIVLAVVSVLCAGGAAVVFFTVGDEVKEAVDATRVRVVEPETLAGRPKVTDPSLQDISRQLEAELNKTLPNATSTVGAFYGDPAKQDLVMVAAASGLNPDPAKTIDETITGTRQSDVAIGEMSAVDPGPLGGEAKCGDAKAADVPIGVCIWSDKGSLGMIMIYFKTGADVQRELVTMRDQIEKKS